MREEYNVIRVSKTTSKDVVRQVLESLQHGHGVALQGNVDKKLIDSVSNVVYNRLRRQARTEKISV